MHCNKSDPLQLYAQNESFSENHDPISFAKASTGVNTITGLLTSGTFAGTIDAMNLDRRLLKQIRAAQVALTLTILTGFLAGLATVLQARQVSQVIARVFLEGQGLAAVMPLLWGLLAVLASRAVFSSLSEIAANRAARQVKEHLRETLARQLLALGPLYAAGERSGELINTATQGIEALDAYFSQYLPQLALAGLLPLAYLVIIAPLDPLSAVVLLLTGPLIPIFMFLIGNTAESLTHRQFTALGRMSAYFLDTLQGLATLKTLGRSREQAGRIAEVSEQYRMATMSVLRVTFLSALALELLSTMGTAIIAVEIGLRLLYGRMGFEPAFFILLLAPEFYLPLRTLGLRFHASMAGVSATRRIFGVMEEKDRYKTAVDPTDAQPRSAASDPRVDTPHGINNQFVDLHKPFLINLEHVCYHYPGREAGLNGVTLTITSSQTTALVGASGSGKSTLAGLLLCFLRPDSGSLRINEISLDAIPVEDWRGQIAWVPQQPHLFHGTLADNLRVARPDAAEEDMLQAAQHAHLLEFVETLPRGLDTVVGEGGAQLSGGQAQRLALARAFLRDAPFLILDEPTAHLDVTQERLLQESTRRLCAGRTVLVIAHRLPTIAQADQIVVLEEGRVAECGRHVEMLAQGGRYARMLALYQGGAVE
jgi:thiol reductant ABC exporter CydD subunit